METVQEFCAWSFSGWEIAEQMIIASIGLHRKKYMLGFTLYVQYHRHAINIINHTKARRQNIVTIFQQWNLQIWNLSLVWVFCSLRYISSQTFVIYLENNTLRVNIVFLEVRKLSYYNSKISILKKMKNYSKYH